MCFPSICLLTYTYLLLHILILTMGNWALNKHFYKNWDHLIFYLNWIVTFWWKLETSFMTIKCGQLWGKFCENNVIYWAMCVMCEIINMFGLCNVWFEKSWKGPVCRNQIIILKQNFFYNSAQTHYRKTVLLQ